MFHRRNLKLLKTFPVQKARKTFFNQGRPFSVRRSDQIENLMIFFLNVQFILSSVYTTTTRLFMSPRLVRALSAYKGLQTHISSHTHTLQQQQQHQQQQQQQQIHALLVIAEWRREERNDK